MGSQRSLGSFEAPNMGQPDMGTGLESLKQMIMLQAGLAGAGAKNQMGQQLQNQPATPNMIHQSQQNQFGGTDVNPAAGATENQFKELMSKSESYGKASAVTSTVYPVMKSAYAQQAGQSGYIPGKLGQLGAKLGADNTDMIARLSTAFNEAKANFAQNYSGNQGISRLLDAFTEGNPTTEDSEKNAFGKLVTFKKAAYGIAKGVAAAGYTSDSLKNANPDEVVAKIGDPKQYISPEEQDAIEKLSVNEYKNAHYMESPDLKSNVSVPSGLKPSFLNKGWASIFPDKDSQNQSSDNSSGMPARNTAPAKAVGWSRSKKAFVDAGGNVVN